MSKLTKLVRHPVLFVQDAVRLRRRRASLPAPTPSGLIPTYVVGFSPWKQFLRGWFPERELHFIPVKTRRAEFDRDWAKRILREPGAEIFIWGFKAEPFLTRFAAANGIRCIFVEDGFIRSIGLGATKTPPFSLTLDSRTPYFNAAMPSDLEQILGTHDFDGDPALMKRADKLMGILLASGLSKYNHAAPVDIHQVYGPKTRKRVLVIGQVEDDASIQHGSSRGHNNNDAVMIAALENPGAQIIYKPHPDVMNHHREMRSNPDDVRHLCQVLDQDIPLAQSFETIDHVYTITSQAGMEALMRGIRVTTLGCPFYAGWGLTDDRQPNARRRRQLTVQQVFAAAYLLYPFYFDPVYKVRLTAEQAVDRLVALKSLARPAQAPSSVTAAQEEAAAVLARHTLHGGGEELPYAVVPGAAATPMAQTAALQDELSSLRRAVMDLRAELARAALPPVISELRQDLRTLGSDLVDLRSRLAEAQPG